MEENQATKLCPYCGETISASAKKCKACGEFLDPVMREIESLKQAHSGGAQIVNNNNNNGMCNMFPSVDKSAPSLPKSRLTYILLAIFLGWTGAHDFYAERFPMGALCLSIVAIPCGIWFLSDVFIPTWSLLLIIIALEIFLVKRDGQGRPFTPIKDK